MTSKKTLNDMIYHDEDGEQILSQKLKTKADKADLSKKADLDESGKVLISQLPSYVSDVKEFPTKANFPAVGESGKIYTDLATNLAYRWGGTVYVEISPSLALGETSSTAYRGDKGKTAYEHSQVISGNPHGVTKEMLGLGDAATKSYVDSAVAGLGGGGGSVQATRITYGDSYGNVTLRLKGETTNPYYNNVLSHDPFVKGASSLGLSVFSSKTISTNQTTNPTFFAYLNGVNPKNVAFELVHYWAGVYTTLATLYGITLANGASFNNTHDILIYHYA